MWIVVALLSFLDLCKFDKYKKLYVVIVLMVLLSILGGIRLNGPDYDVYYSYFTTNFTLINFQDAPEKFEAGYAFINYIIKEITNSFNVLNFFLTSIICIFKYQIFTHIAPFPLLTFLLNFSYYYGDAYVMRQSVAVGLTAFSFIYIVKRSLIRFLLVVFMASLFHRTAVVFVAAYWIYTWQLSTQKILLLLIVSFLIGYNELVGGVIQNITGVDSTYIDKIMMYSDGKYDSYGATVDPQTKVIISLLKRYIILFVLLYYRKSINAKYSYYNGLFNIILTSNIIYTVFSFAIPEVALRIVANYGYFEVVAVAMILAVYKNIIPKMLIWLLILVYSFTKYYYGMNILPEVFYPMRTIFM